MFTNDMAEANQEDIVIKGLNVDALENLLNFAYTGKIRIDTSNVENLLIGANFLQITSVKEACATFMQKRLSGQNVLGIKRFAEKYYCKNLVDESVKVIERVT